MKFQLKALAAAVVLAASIPAHAAIDTAASGNSSFVLTVFDKIANVQASFDLGKNYLDFNMNAASGAVSNVTAPGTTFSWDLAGNADYSAAWTSFLGAATLPNIQYAITAADNLGAGAGSRGYITTLAAPGAALVTSGMTTALGNFDTYIGTQPHVAANGSLFTASAATANTLYNNNRVGGTQTGPTTAGILGSNLGVIQVTGSASSFTNTTQTVFGNGAHFNLASNGTLVYATAPVPEADTWAMMLLGLSFMGFVARRKQA
jgi:hypothetical protein